MFDVLQQFVSKCIRFLDRIIQEKIVAKLQKKVNDFSVKSGSKNIRGLGILPYGNLFRSVGRLNVKNFACVMTWAVLAMVVFDTPKGCVGVWKTIVLVQREQARLRIDKINSDDIKREI